jgi:hypothetical protein
LELFVLVAMAGVFAGPGLELFVLVAMAGVFAGPGLELFGLVAIAGGLLGKLCSPFRLDFGAVVGWVGLGAGGFVLDFGAVVGWVPFFLSSLGLRAKMEVQTAHPKIKAKKNLLKINKLTTPLI